MERGGLPAEMLGAMAQGTQSPATVFHGSPHLFQRFDASKIGTGEGNQTFGYGLYFAENPAVAGDYARQLGGDPKDEILRLVSRLRNEASSGTQLSADEVLFAQKGLPGLEPLRNDSRFANLAIRASNDDKEALKELTKMAESYGKAGNIYQVDLPDEQIARMLDFDKPLSQQAQPVREALSRLGIAVDDRKLADFDDALLGALTSDAPAGALPRRPMNMTGEEVIKELQRNPSRYLPQMMQGRELTQAMINPAQGASAVLRQAGIPGIRYLDQGSRATSGGELLDVFKTPSGWKSKIKVTNRSGVGFQSPTDTVTTSMPFKTEDEARQWAQGKIGGGTSNFVVFPGMEDMLRIEQINEQPIQSLFQTLGR
jgi:hypothetical protein